MSSWKEAMHTNWCRRHYRWSWHFHGIAKFSQGLRKFRIGSENFTILAKFSLWSHFRHDSEIYCAWRNLKFRYALNFHYIEKVTVHSENSNFRYIAKFTTLRICCLYVFYPNDPVLCNSHFIPNVIIYFWYFWYFTSLVWLYKPPYNIL